MSIKPRPAPEAITIIHGFVETKEATGTWFVGARNGVPSID
jgi:hypothetical protein